MFATRHMFMINERRNVNMPIIRILINFNEFVSIEQFTHWLTDVDSYSTAQEDYCDINNLQIHLPWVPVCTLKAGLCLMQLTVIQATNEKALALKQRANAPVAYHLASDQTDLVQALQGICILHDVLNNEISCQDQAIQAVQANGTAHVLFFSSLLMALVAFYIRLNA